MANKKQLENMDSQEVTSSVTPPAPVRRRQPARKAKGKVTSSSDTASINLPTPSQDETEAPVEADVVKAAAHSHDEATKPVKPPVARKKPARKAAAQPHDEATKPVKPPVARKKPARKAAKKTPSPSHTASSSLPAPPSTKRKATVETDDTQASVQPNLAGETPTKKPRPQETIQGKLPWAPKEKRARPFVEEPPQKFIEKLRSTYIERMFVVGHEAKGLKNESAPNPEIAFDFVGSTGNLYKTVIRKVPTCNCPDKRFRNPAQCKHITYALVHTLKAPAHLQYQAAFLSSEIHEMWKECSLSRVQPTTTEDDEGKRKPIEGDCPICFMELKAEEKIVWCQSSCGNNVHKDCFDKWAIQSRLTSGIRCVYCRAEWAKKDENNVEALRKRAVIVSGGYRNVAAQLGPDPQRGMNSTLYYVPRLYLNPSSFTNVHRLKTDYSIYSSPSTAQE
ncbi:hypothetical protein N7456_002027 [Penicillium angulare]|uniref:Zinc finger, RING-type n=1 Tax=Penicillium angulare TaxID=116970 RepID=A0A9W9G7V2_9EURO|nr:hypothetical protein N7456_002027 [Penicillium angulare]